MLSKKIKLQIRILIIAASFLFIFVNVYLGILRTQERESQNSSFYTWISSIKPNEIKRIEIYESDELGKFVSTKKIFNDDYSINSFTMAMRDIYQWSPNRPDLFGTVDMKIVLQNQKEIYIACYFKYSSDNLYLFEETAFCRNPTSETYPKLNSAEKEKIIIIPRIKSKKLYAWLNDQGLLEF